MSTYLHAVTHQHIGGIGCTVVGTEYLGEKAKQGKETETIE